jgi:hypothetical protein
MVNMRMKKKKKKTIFLIHYEIGLITGDLCISLGILLVNTFFCYKSDSFSISRSISAHRYAGQIEKNLSSLNGHSSTERDACDPSLNDHFRTLTTGEKGRVQPTAPDVVLIFVQNSVHDRMAHEKMSLVVNWKVAHPAR